MTKRRKLKTNSSIILLVLIALILLKAEWVKGGNSNFEHTNLKEGSSGENASDQTHIYVGNDEIAEYFFGPLANNNSYILDGINKCLNSFHFITCIKMLLLSKINNAVSLMEKPSFTQSDIRLLNGLFVLKTKNETNSSFSDDENNELNLDEEISAKIRKVFWKRSLLINLFPKLKIEIEPDFRKRSDFICFNYTVRKETDLINPNKENEGRKRKSGMSMMMMVPQLIMLGLMPFTLASLKAMVMNAVMINMMALNGAIFMTIRNLVFGPRQGDNVKYVNYGYSKNRQTQSKKPVLIIHSPAAFVKQPPVYRKSVQGQYSSQYQALENYIPTNGGNSQHYEHQHGGKTEDYEDSYYAVQQDENYYRRLSFGKDGKKQESGT